MLRKIGFTVGVLVVGLCFATFAYSGEDEHKMSPEEAAAMSAWMKASTPGPHHARLQKSVGNWKTTVKVWHGPGDPQVSMGKSTIKSILGGRYVEEHFEGEAMGQPFTGRGIAGYNNITQCYESLWLDTMSTSMLQFEGKYDESSKTLTQYASAIDAVTGSKIHFRSVMKDSGSDKCVFEMYRTGPDGHETKELEITYERM